MSTPYVHNSQHSLPFFTPGSRCFLDNKFAESLNEEFPAFDPDLANGESENVGLNCIHENLTEPGHTFVKLDQLCRGESFLSLMASLTGIPAMIHDPHYFGGGAHGNCSGQDLDLHIDFNHHPARNVHWCLNFISFLNKTW